MSITKSYNKYTNTYYAYETTYEWSEEKQKKIQRKRCIGQFNPDTGEVIPNGSVGRPGVPKRTPSPVKSVGSREMPTPVQGADIDKLASKLVKIEGILQTLSSEIHDLRAEVNSLSAPDRSKA